MTVTVNKQGIAKELGVSLQTISNYQRQGMPCTKRGRGWEFNVEKCKVWVKDYKDGVATQKTENDAARLSLISEQTRKEAALASLREIELAEAQGKYVDTEEVFAAYADDLAKVRQQLLSLPGKVAPLMIGHDSPKEPEHIILDEINNILKELSGDE